jgi:SAM-dependent methyltransferase
MHTALYDKEFFGEQRGGSARSAKAIVPLLLEKFPIRSVIDIGCGVGPWLRTFTEHGIHDVIGLDGDYIKREALEIPQDRFQATDLTSDFQITRRYDLACSLEVAEHLPLDVGPRLIEKLCQAAPVILFSAAIPGQGGTGHVNEAWQDEWRGQFAHHGYHPLDFIRWQVWGLAEVEWWYQQNLVVYVDATQLSMSSDFRPVQEMISLNVVHPDCYARQVEAATTYFSKAIKQLPALFSNAVKRRLGSGR